MRLGNTPDCFQTKNNKKIRKTNKTLNLYDDGSGGRCGRGMVLFRNTCNMFLRHLANFLSSAFSLCASENVCCHVCLAVCGGVLRVFHPRHHAGYVATSVTVKAIILMVGVCT